MSLQYVYGLRVCVCACVRVCVCVRACVCARLADHRARMDKLGTFQSQIQQWSFG